MGKEYDFHEKFQIVMGAWRKTGDLRFTALGLNTLSLGAIETGKYNEARTALEESIAINSSIGDRWGLGTAYRVMGLSAQAQGEHTYALEYFDKSLQIFIELGARWDVARLLLEMGGSTFALGNVSEANDLWCESLQLSIETHGIITTVGAIVGIATVHIARANYQYALQLLFFSVNHPAVIQETKTRAVKLIAELKEKLTPTEIAEAQNSAARNTVESVVKDILSRL